MKSMLFCHKVKVKDQKDNYTWLDCQILDIGVIKRNKGGKYWLPIYIFIPCFGKYWVNFDDIKDKFNHG